MVRRIVTACAAMLVACLLSGTRSGAQDVANAPFSATADLAGGAHVDAFVTRSQDGHRVTLPAAVVPSLRPGDEIAVSFPDYTRPPSSVNYHVNVAFITEVAPQHWLYPKSGPTDRLFVTGRSRDASTAPLPPLRFTYDAGAKRGIPIFFIVPEDAKTRGMDGVRDYVAAHPTDFKNMSESANDAVDRYSWFRDFLASLAQGSLDPLSAHQRISDVAASLGASPTSIDACYAQGGSQADVAGCIKGALVAVQYQTNIEAPTQAQFFGGLASAASPVQFAFYLQPMLAIWKIFTQAGHHEYEYLPTSLRLAEPYRPKPRNEELLMGLKVPTLRPPAAYSSVLFFSIGDPQAAANPPVDVSDASPAGICLRDDRIALPFHLSRTSTFVNDTALLVAPDGAAAYHLPIDPRSADAPVLSRSDLRGNAGGYAVRLSGRFGFDPLAQADRILARIAVPGPANWMVAALPHRPPLSGGSLDLVATSSAAPCLSNAELQIGSAAPIPLERKALDERRVELHASLAKVPPGRARLVFYQDDPVHHTQLESTSTIAIEPPPARVDPASAPIVFIGDRSMAVTGSGFETIGALRLNGTTYRKDRGSASEFACFTGPPFGGSGIEAGQMVSAQLLPQDGQRGEAFVMKVGAARPTLLPAQVTPDTSTHLSTDRIRVALTSLSGPLPVRREIRLRHALPVRTPCNAFGLGNAFVSIPEADTREVSPATLDVTVRAARELGDRAYGTLEISLLDAETKQSSDWVELPGRFIRAPDVSRIACPSDPSTPCTLFGTGLGAIDAIEEPSGDFVRPDADCRPRPSTPSCVLVPHLAHYRLRLADGHLTIAIPDSLINAPAPAGSPAPSTSPSHP